MTTLSTQGRAALYEYITAAVRGDSSGLNVAGVVADKRIADSDLAAVIATVCEASEQPLPEVDIGNRHQLAHALRDMIDMQLGRPAALDAAPQLVIQHSAKWKDPMGDDALNVSSPKASNIAAGSSTHTQRVLRELRHQIGWMPLSYVGFTNEVLINDALDHVREAFIKKNMQVGKPRAVAEAECQSQYIAIVEHYRKKAQGLVYDPDRPVEYDTSQPTSRWVDLSPQAVIDIKQEYEKIKQHRDEAKSLGALLRSMGISSTSSKVVEAVERLRATRIQSLIEQESVSQDEAVRQVDHNFIEIKQYPRSGRREVIIHPAAVAEVQRVLGEYFPGRKPGRKQSDVLAGTGRER